MGHLKHRAVCQIARVPARETCPYTTDSWLQLKAIKEKDVREKWRKRGNIDSNPSFHPVGLGNPAVKTETERWRD
jgi:hypothetical protein